MRYGQQILKLPKMFFSELVPTVIDRFKVAFPELVDAQSFVTEVIRDEELQFSRTLERGLAYFARVADKAQAEGKTQISGEAAFYLYGTMGFPYDLTELMAEERGMTVDKEGFDLESENHRLASKSSKVASGAVSLVLESEQTSHLMSGLGLSPTDTSFKYEAFCKPTATVVALYNGKEFVDRIDDPAATIGVILDKTSFYAEAGGQEGDAGELLQADDSDDKALFEVGEAQT